MGSSSTSWSSESNTHAGTSKVYSSSTWDAIVSTDGLKINASEAATAQIELWADEGDDNADKWKWQVADGGSMTWQSYTSGSYAAKLTLGVNGDLTIAGDLAISGGNITTALTLDSTLTIGANTDGHDVKFFGNASGKYMLWDESDDSLALAGSTASSSGLKIDGANTNGFSMLSDIYVAGESQFNSGIIYSGGATYIASKVYGASDANYTESGGWKSSQDEVTARGCAIVLDGSAGSMSVYYGASNASVTPGTTKTLTRGLYLGEDGDFGIGTAAPTRRFHVYDNVASGYSAVFQNDGDNLNRYGIIVMGGADDGATAGGETSYFTATDGDGTVIGSLGHNTSGNFVINATSDSRLKENISDTQLDGLNLCNQIKVREFNWKDYKGGLKNRAGFIAQEVQEVLPEAASGTDGAMKTEVVSKAKDEIKDEEGNIIQSKQDEVTRTVIDAMSVSQESFIPIMMKAIQQLSSKVTTLENA